MKQQRHRLLILLGILLALGIEERLAASHGHRPTKEPGERDSINFYYDADSHYFITVTKSTCFAVPLEKDEYDHVHSSIGMDDLELRMIREWIGKLPETRIYHDDQYFPQNALTHCRGRDIYFLQRNVTTVFGTTSQSASATSAAIVG